MDIGLSDLVDVGGFALALAGAMWAVFRYMAALSEKLADRIASVDGKLGERIDSVEREFYSRLDAAAEAGRLRAEAVQAQESKARHDLGNNMARALTELKADARAADEKLERRLDEMQRDMVLKADMQASEARIVARFDRLETKFDDLFKRRAVE